MMPVMILRGSEDVFYKAKVDSCIGMNQHRMYCHENNVGIEGDFWKPKYIQWYEGHWAGNEDVYEMCSGTRQPVHVLRGMMYWMKPPQVGVRMKETMRSVLKQVSYKKREEQFHYEWQLLYPLLNTG